MMLSVYLGSSDKRTPDPDFLIAQLHSLVHHNLSEKQRNQWQKDIARIEKYLHQSTNKSNVRAYVFFSSDDFWQVFNFEFFMQPLLKISKERYLDQILKALNKYQKYLILLADREKARLFTVHLGRIEEHKDIFVGEVPQNVKAKKIDWGRDNKIFRHIEQHLHYHLQFIAKAVLSFSQNKGIQFIILGGHREMIPKLRAHLFYPLNKMVKGEFVTALNIPKDHILEKSKIIATGLSSYFIITTIFSLI